MSACMCNGAVAVARNSVNTLYFSGIAAVNNSTAMLFAF